MRFLAADGRVWLFDAARRDPQLDTRVRELGEQAAVVQLLDRHNRDCAADDAAAGASRTTWCRDDCRGRRSRDFVLSLRLRWWREVAVWWPERRILLVADALGTIPFFGRASSPPASIPSSRWPPRSLRGLAPDHLLVGHGEGDP